MIKYLFNHPDVTNRGHPKPEQSLIHKKIGYEREWELQHLEGLGIGFSQGPTWESQRKMALRILYEFGFGRSTSEEVVASEVSRFLQFLQKNHENEPVHLKDMFNLPILNVLWLFAAGTQYDYDNPRLQEIVSLMHIWFTAADFGTASSLMHMSLPPWIFQLFPKFLNRHAGGQERIRIPL